MLAHKSPSGSPASEAGRSFADAGDANSQPLMVESTATISPYSMTASAGYETSQPSEPTNASAHAHHHHYTGDTDAAVDARRDDEDNDSDMIDVDEGGASLHNIDTDDAIQLLPTLSLHDTALESGVSMVTANHTSLPPLIPITVEQPATFGPPSDNPIMAELELPLAVEEVSDEDGEQPVATLTIGDQIMDIMQEINEDDELGHPHFFTNPNPGALTPDNHNSLSFLRYWRRLKEQGELRHVRETPRNETSMAKLERRRITYEQLKGDECDIQGINWKPIGITRNSARKFRIGTFRNYTNQLGSDVWTTSTPDRLLSRHENYFKFRSMDLRPDVRLLHFQLRNIFGCASRTRVFYPSESSTVKELDPTTGRFQTAMVFKDDEDAAVTTLAAEHGILVTGSYFGKYRYRHLDTGDIPSYGDGTLTDHPSGITNHVQISPSRRSSVPLAAFSSNDYGFRVVDLATNQMVSNQMYEYAVNCTVLSPCKRLRALVGDTKDVVITETDTGEIIETLEGHRDFGFAIDWAPDGYTIATGNQDRSIRIWDARKWKNTKGESISIAEIRTEMAGVRNLRFSPLGSGKRLLLAAEEADVVNIIDAQTFSSKQTVDVFGELAGVFFTSAGQEVVALSSDSVRGGVLCLERCDHGEEDSFSYKPRPYSRDRDWWRTSRYDWVPTPQEAVNHPRSEVTITQKRRQAAMVDDWFF